METCITDEKENVVQQKFAKDDGLDPSLCCGNKNGALQDNFLKFMQQKKKERQLMKLQRNGEFTGNGRTEAAKDALRQKFVDTAKKYLGVPYAERFKETDVPVAPLYLDCCGLVRQAVQDLQDDFGFVMGRWNQAYQMDTLPIVLQEHELKPGDLIFYEGLYNSKRSKPQKHNNVHVEIFLGGETGEATIGSRYHRGNVSIFPSYKFKSTTWDLVQFHFRSLDTWLNGECKSHCSEHPWHSDLLGLAAAAGKRSIFHEDSDDESAGGGDIEGDEEEETEAEVNADAAVNSAEVDAASPPSPECADDAALTADPSTSVAATAAAPALQPTTSPQRVKDPVRRPRQASADLSKTSTSAPDSASKAQRSQSADRLRSNELIGDDPEDSDVGGVSGQKVASSPSRALGNKRVGAVRASIAAAAVKATEGDAKRASAVSTDTGMSAKEKAKAGGKDKDGVPPLTYYVGKGNGWRLVKDSMDKRGWQQLPFEYSFSSRFGLKWVERRSQIDYRAHTPGQLVNHIPNNDCITTKAALLATLREKYCRVPATSTVRMATPWLPETYQLDSPADVAAMLAVENQLIEAKAGTKGEVAGEAGEGASGVSAAPGAPGASAASGASWGCLWIYKPSCNNRGRGIRVVRGKEALDLVCYGKNTGDPETTIAPSPGILQRYLENPLLAGVEGFKFDVRCYLLVARNDPSYMAYYHPGYCRLSLKRYSASEESLADPTVHLTNASVQKKDPLYSENKDMQIQTIAEVADKIEQNGQPAQADFLRNELDTHIKQCMVDVLKAAIPKLTRKKGLFDLFGFDFMVTEDSQLKLLEVNTNPALSLDNHVLADLLPGVVDGTIELVLRTQGPVGGLPVTGAGAGAVTGAGAGALAGTGAGEDATPEISADTTAHLAAATTLPLTGAVAASAGAGAAGAPPGRYELLYDEESGFEYKSQQRMDKEAKREAKKHTATA